MNEDKPQARDREPQIWGTHNRNIRSTFEAMWSVALEAEANELHQRLVRIEAAVADSLAAMRSPGGAMQRPCSKEQIGDRWLSESRIWRGYQLRGEPKFDGPKQDRICFGPLLSGEGASPRHRRTACWVQDCALAGCDPDHTAAVDPPSPSRSLSGGQAALHPLDVSGLSTCTRGSGEWPRSRDRTGTPDFRPARRPSRRAIASGPCVSSPAGRSSGLEARSLLTSTTRGPPRRSGCGTGLQAQPDTRSRSAPSGPFSTNSCVIRYVSAIDCAPIPSSDDSIRTPLRSGAAASGAGAKPLMSSALWTRCGPGIAARRQAHRRGRRVRKSGGRGVGHLKAVSSEREQNRYILR